MVSAISGTIGEIKRSIHDRTFIDKLISGFNNIYHNASHSEVTSWKQSLMPFFELFPDECNNIQALIEYQMPIGGERADVILLGGNSQKPRGYIIELKQWSDMEIDTATGDLLVPGIGLQKNPLLQALTYQGKIHLFHLIGSNYGLKSCVVLHNIESGDKEGIYNNADCAPYDCKLCYKNDIEDLLSSIKSHLLPIQLNADEYKKFDNSPYFQSDHLFDILKKHSKDIASRAESALAKDGFGLTEEQEKLVNDILTSVDAGEEKVFIIRGGPGSGKTLVAITLLLRAAENRISSILALRNNRLQANLRKCFELSYPGASGMMIFYEVQNSQGIGDPKFDKHFNLVIIDEGQRMRNHARKDDPYSPLANSLSHSPITVVFLDEQQRLNPVEAGTIQEYENAAGSLNKVVIKGQLSTAIRCRGGQPYHDWVDDLLSNSNCHMQKQSWQSKYQFESCKTIEELLEKLNNVCSSNNRVALVASFTESPGNPTVSKPDNVRIGYPLTSEYSLYKNSNVCIRWLMNPNEYVNYWLKGKSNDLKQTASIYGSQGFESDYVGVIWGRDLIWRNNQWTIGNADDCFDNIDGLISKRNGHKTWCNNAHELLVNRYRIFLTRGIKGTFVFCEDPETLIYLQSLLN